MGTQLHVLSFLFVLVAVLDTTRAQWPMYIPGAPIDRSVIPIEHALFGVNYGARYACQSGFYNIPCALALIPDSSLCKNTPLTVSRTATIGTQVLLTITVKDSLVISCGATKNVPDDQLMPPGTKLVYTLNGTYPDIYGPSYDPPITLEAAANEYMFVLARCLEPGKTAGRIAYMERLPSGSYMCVLEGGTWKYATHYKPLNLPQCQPWLVGADKCDGQTIVDQGGIPTPLTPTPSIPAPASVPSLSPSSTSPVPTHSNAPASATRSFPSASSLLLLLSLGLLTL